MSRKVKNWLCGTALASAVVLSAASWAMGPHGGMGPPPEGMGDPSMMMTHMSERLGLSAEQQEKVKSLLSASQEASAADRKRMQELRTELMAMKTQFDQDKAHKIADEIGQITGRMVYQGSDTFSQIYQLLDPSQQAKLDAMMARRGERRGKPGAEGQRPPAQ